MKRLNRLYPIVAPRTITITGTAAVIAVVTAVPMLVASAVKSILKLLDVILATGQIGNQAHPDLVIYVNH